MKRMIAAAGALLLGTSALAYAGSVDKSAMEPTTASGDVKVADNTLLSDWDKARVDAWQKTFAASKTDMTASTDSKLALASLDKDLAPLALQETGGKVATASADDMADAKVQTAMVDKSAYVGTGGPLEEASATPAVVQPSNANPEHDARGIPVMSDVAFVPPGFNGSGGAVGGPVESGDDESYPACTRERTDNCIQLYERGVSAQADKVSATTAMGGPYEPVGDDMALNSSAASETAMNGDGTVDAALGETSDSAVETADATVADHSAYQGVGGPIEAQSGYPPCSPGPGDDRCIQLYEPGVTGAGN